MSYLVHLRQFEGPLGLLLYLIRKEEMDIFDINVNQITGQYLEYIRQMKELDLEVAGEFVAMAATLIHIKSRMLLPNYNEEGEVVEAEDPRKELVQKLLEYQRYQDAAKRLYERPLLGRDIFARGVRADFRTDEELGEVLIDEDGLFGLISSYRKAVRKAVKYVHQVRPRVQSIAMRVMQIKERLIVGTRVILRDLLGIGEGSPRAQLLVTFLSMLELGRMGYVSIFQNEIYGDIYIDPLRPIERNVLERVQEFDSGDTEAIANSMINEAIEEKIDMAEAMQLEVDQPQRQLALELMEAGMLVPQLDGAGIEGFVDIASDDEILAAEAEIDGVVLAAPVVGVAVAVAEPIAEIAMHAEAPTEPEPLAPVVDTSTQAESAMQSEAPLEESPIEMSANGEPTADMIAESNFEEAPVVESKPEPESVAESVAEPAPVATPELEMLADAAPELVEELEVEEIVDTPAEESAEAFFAATTAFEPAPVPAQPDAPNYAGASAFEHEPERAEREHDPAADHEPEPKPDGSKDPESFV